MTNRQLSITTLGFMFAIGLCVRTAAGQQESGATSPVKLVSSRVTLAGTSNIHAYSASTTAARITDVQVADDASGAAGWDRILEPGRLEAFAIVIPAATLSSPKEGLDKNMHKALKVSEHPNITFRLSRLEGFTATGPARGVGVLEVAGTARQVTLTLKTQQTANSVTVTGEVELLMTDFGITPPKAMLGMLKTDPKVTVSFEAVLTVPLT